jgi:hypothetical protein
MKNTIFFIFGAFRSGTTAFCQMLNMADKVAVFIEQSPKLCLEARLLYEERLTTPEDVIWQARNQNIQKVIENGLTYVDKNPNYLLFIPFLLEKFDCKFIYLHRDGRDVVRSMMDWHDVQKKTIYTLAEDDINSDRFDGANYPWDYSLLRPKKSEKLYSEWKSLSRFQKCSWYWAQYNRLALDMINHVNQPHRFMKINMTGVTAKDVEAVYQFMGLTGFERTKVDELLKARINSVKQRSGQADQFPQWTHWSEDLYHSFDKFASPTMYYLGYYC